ncbi:GNAT family N-acetyltransferase [Nocardioides alcanivorans]|uniref:GNAT family N-acetyltransferase n=1 Tax=Nocardioides alcanivorans TaxID=2897352 RepID=UPI001F239537|nr:GNAT family N-acetyltransferase [Nocardioides alcanivorans]
MRLDFRSATAADVPGLVALIESAYRGDSSRVGWTTEADLLAGQRTDVDEVRQVIDAPESVMLIASPATYPALVAACCNLQRRGDRTYFGMFAVAPELQSGGLGAALLARAEGFAREAWTSTHLEMTVIRQRSDLIAYYLRRGFRDTGRRLPFPYGDDRAGLPLREDLEFTVLEKQLA